ncbi:unnamed protein product [Oncorhynchus mykiss]|uniref:Protein kinase domain-containing protein n=1 Tax=Oncorhynchus mykiss TaxID=8022 RepID=A0A060Y4P7_ONCMY|nr:unnamed protein product [Oncorhynchus mykiss]
MCYQGDLKRYLRAQRKSDGMTPDLLTREMLTLQRMAFEITSGLLHLHENNYIHSDLALRNCLLTSDLTVRIGDYGLSHNHYKDDYYLTSDKLWIPLRWIAPELLEEYRGSLIVTDQTKTSNLWSLGVVIWELFEFGSQPHRHLSDEEVLTFVIRERQITLAQPRLKLSHADYWSSCWLPPSQRPSIAEVFLLLSSLLAAERGMSRRSVGEDEEDEDEEYEEGRGRRGESDESFERRWDSLRPPAFQAAASERQREREYGRDDRGNSYPLLEAVGNCITPSSTELDDILTVTETSKGLNFEQSLDTPTVVPVISARSPSLASDVTDAKKSPMHLFLTEISSVSESNDAKSKEGRTSWEGETEREKKRDGERSGNFLQPLRGGMRRSRSLATELGSTEQTLGPDRNTQMGTEVERVRKGSIQRDLFLTEISNTGRMDAGMERDPVKFLHPPGSRSRPYTYTCAPGLPSYAEAEEAYSRGMRRSRSLLSEITVGRQESQETEKETEKGQMTREEFLKEIQSAETFLTEIISRQNATASNKHCEDLSQSPTPMSPEYESICIDPDSSQTIRFQSESSIRTSNRGKDDVAPEAIYAQVTKRAKKSEMKVTIRPEIPVLQIGSNKQSVKQEEGYSQPWPGDFVFSEIMPKNGLLLYQTFPSTKTEEDVSEGPALPSRGQNNVGERNCERMKGDAEVRDTGQGCQKQEVVDDILHDLTTETSETDRACQIESKDHKEEGSESSKGWDSQMKNDTSHSNQIKSNCSNAQSHNPNVESFLQINKQNSQINQEGRSDPSQKSPAAVPTTPDWDPSSDLSLSTMTPSDSFLSSLTPSSADCLTPGDPCVGGEGPGGWRVLGTETPHRDSAYFSDSDWEGEGLGRKGSDGLSVTRPGSGRGGERGTLTGIEEKTELEDEGETGGKSLLKRISNKGIDIERERRHIQENDLSLKEVEHKTGLESEQREDSGMFHNESGESDEKGLVHPVLLSDNSQTKKNNEFIAKLFSNLDDAPLKGFSYNDGTQICNHYTEGVISHVESDDFRFHDSTDKVLTLPSNSTTKTDCLKLISAIQTKDNKLENEELPGIEDRENDNSMKDTTEPVTATNDEESKLASSFWAEEVTEVSEREDGQDLEIQHTDANELGLRNLCYSEESEDERAKAKSETEKQLAAGELCNAMKEKSPQRGPVMGSQSGSLSRDGSAETDLEMKAKELWNTLEEGEGRGEGVVRGEFDCHRFQQGDLHLWPSENDQWASSENRSQEAELGLEFFSAFGKTWEEREQLVVGREFWEAEENDELAGSEPHPAVLQDSEDTSNDERQGRVAYLEIKRELSQKQVLSSSIDSQLSQALDVQQEENIENPDRFDDDDEQNVEGDQLVVEVENREIPEHETNARGREQFRSLTEMVDIVNTSEDLRDISLLCDLVSYPNDNDLEDIASCTDLSGSQGDNFQFSSVDFPSPPPSIDLDMQEDRLQSLDDSFPSPPPSVIEIDDDRGLINLDYLGSDFITSAERDPTMPPTPHTDIPEPPPLPPATTHSRGISANLDLSPVHPTLPLFSGESQNQSRLTSNISEDDRNNLSQKNTTTTLPSFLQSPLNTIPELLISEWKDLDEEPLEDFEKLEQLCCISGDEEDTLGDLFLGNLELLESMKKTPEQKTKGSGESDKDEATCGTSMPEGKRRVELKEDVDGISESADWLARHELQFPSALSPCHSPDSKDQRSLSKMPTKNGLMMQVCEERLQFSLCENVKTNVLRGATVSDSVILRPWGDQSFDGGGDAVSVKDVGSEEEPDTEPNSEPQSESDATDSEPLTVIQQPEVTPPQPVANQAMKAKLARLSLSLSLPPLPLALPLSSSSRRVIVVTETDVGKRVGLRSLLKSPREPIDKEKDRGRNVSFFDDVTVYLFDQETPTSELSSSTCTSPAPAPNKSTKFDLHGTCVFHPVSRSPNSKGKDSKRKGDLSVKPRSPVGANPVTSSRFTVSPADDPHLV